MADTAPGKGSVWRPRTKGERLNRCAAVSIGVFHSNNCKMQHLPGAAYCYYHDKVARGVVDWFFDQRSGLSHVTVPPSHYYPVFPLPPNGYVLIERLAA